MVEIGKIPLLPPPSPFLSSSSPFQMQGPSLLHLVERSSPDSIHDNVLDWFDNHSREEIQAAAKEGNEKGETALHIILKSNVKDGDDSSIQSRRFTQTDDCDGSSLISVIKKFVDYAEDSLSIQDRSGYLPLHIACQDRTCSFDVIKMLIEAYPAGLGVTSNRDSTIMKHTPFGWDYATSVGGHFTEFIQYIVKSDVCRSRLKESTIETRRARHRILIHCKDYVPLDILKKGMLNEKNLESNAMVRWLNEMPCKRSVVFSMVFELYLHLAWISIFIHTTILHIEQDQSIQGWEPVALLVCSIVFLMQEFYQMYRFTVTNATLAYWIDFWNWIDLTTSSLVLSSAIKFLQNDQSSAADNLLITTGVFQFILFTSYLKKVSCFPSIVREFRFIP